MKTKAIEICLVSVVLILIALLVGCEDKAEANENDFKYSGPHGNFRSKLRDLETPNVLKKSPTFDVLMNLIILLHERNYEQSERIISLESRISALEARVEPNEHTVTYNGTKTIFRCDGKIFRTIAGEGNLSGECPFCNKWIQTSGTGNNHDVVEIPQSCFEAKDPNED